MNSKVFTAFFLLFGVLAICQALNDDQNTDTRNKIPHAVLRPGLNPESINSDIKSRHPHARRFAPGMRENDRDMPSRGDIPRVPNSGDTQSSGPSFKNLQKKVVSTV